MKPAVGICLSLVGGYVAGCMGGTATCGSRFSWSDFWQVLIFAPIGLAKLADDFNWLHLVALAGVIELLAMILIAKKSGRIGLAYVGVFVAVGLLAFVGGGVVAGLLSLAGIEGRVHTNAICGQFADHVAGVSLCAVS